MALHVSAAWGPVEIKLTATQQDLSDSEVKANPPTFKWTTTNLTLNTEQVVQLLANSFNTNFPDGASLAISGCGDLAVVDATGTNVLLNVSAVLSTSIETVLTGQAVDSANGGFQAHFSGDAVFTYDDESFITTDGKHTSFTFHGRFLQHMSASNKTEKANTTSVLTGGSGSGTLRNKTTVFTGTIKAHTPDACF